MIGCHSHPIPSDTSNVTSFFSPARVINTNSSLMPNDKALFNATGGTTLTNEIFTFDGTKWENEGSSISSNVSEATTLTALYPAYNSNNILITENPYSDNELEDILIAQCTFTNKTDIELCFKHLFSMLTIHIQSPLKESISSFSITAPKVTNMQADGNFSTEGTHTTIPTLNDTGDYTFIIPSVEDCNLTLSFTMGEETISHNLTHTFTSGYKYECNITDREQVGINSAEELIAFSRLINNLSSDNYKLSDFGEEQEEGQMLYRLLTDIDFTGINGEDLLPICYNQDNTFNDIFDGGGHTISNLTINPSGGVAGLFGRIGSTGTIKNLFLDDCSLNITENTSAGVGSIAGICTGIISDCGVTNGTISNKVESYTGGIVGVLRNGVIINSFIKDSQVTSTNASVGGVVGKIETGNIINCFAASNTITRGSNYCGGFCGYSDNGKIINCYVYKQTLKTTSNRGQIIGHGYNSSVSYCYTNTSSPALIIYNREESCSVLSCKTYNSSTFFIGDSNIVNVLNQWIETNQSSYSYTFTRWKEDETSTLPAIFQ